MHIERRTRQQLAGMSVEQLCALDLEYAGEINRLNEDRGLMRTQLNAAAMEEWGMKANDAVRKYQATRKQAEVQGVPQVEMKGVPVEGLRA